MVIKSLTQLLFCNLLAFSNYLFVGDVLLLLFTWFYSKPRDNFKFSEKAKTSLKCSFFKAGFLKQTVANKSKLFDFDTFKYKNHFDELCQI